MRVKQVRREKMGIKVKLKSGVIFNFIKVQMVNLGSWRSCERSGETDVKVYRLLL